jgi:hypothetical protein
MCKKTKEKLCKKKSFANRVDHVVPFFSPSASADSATATTARRVKRADNFILKDLRRLKINFPQDPD